MLAKDGTQSNTDSGHVSHPALGLHLVARTTFRNHSINSHKGCTSSPLSHLEGSMSSAEANRSPF